MPRLQSKQKITVFPSEKTLFLSFFLQISDFEFYSSNFKILKISDRFADQLNNSTVNNKNASDYSLSMHLSVFMMFCSYEFTLH